MDLPETKLRRQRIRLTLSEKESVATQVLIRASRKPQGSTHEKADPELNLLDRIRAQQAPCYAHTLFVTHPYNWNYERKESEK
ncbi:hypothetical protein RRG08_025042 [Elysia crispata]|uniref:Uncharacterized protein n=1 Tax=Elysia crispata TaxID=231223 RepID=A0AAE1E368_9GAST|nr:hypothetical protein RRG08_025042 [Elysia crispata]